MKWRNIETAREGRRDREREIGWEMRRGGIPDREMINWKEDRVSVSSSCCALNEGYIFLLNNWQFKSPWEEWTNSRAGLDVLSSASLDRTSRCHRWTSPSHHLNLHLKPCYLLKEEHGSATPASPSSPSQPGTAVTNVHNIRPPLSPLVPTWSLCERLFFRPLCQCDSDTEATLWPSLVPYARVHGAFLQAHHFRMLLSKQPLYFTTFRCHDVMRLKNLFLGRNNNSNVCF